MDTTDDNILLALYTLFWVISFIVYHYRNRHIDGGSAVMASYIVYCFFSFITLNDEFFDDTYEHLSLFPFIYLYVMLMLALSPAIKLHRSPVIIIKDPHSKALLIPCYIAILCICVQIPSILSNFNSNFVSILTLYYITCYMTAPFLFSFFSSHEKIKTSIFSSFCFSPLSSE